MSGSQRTAGADVVDSQHLPSLARAEPKAGNRVPLFTIPFYGKALPMLYTVAVVLLVLWLLGFLAFHVGGGLIHLLLVIAVVVFLFQIITGRRAL